MLDKKLFPFDSTNESIRVTKKRLYSEDREKCNVDHKKDRTAEKYRETVRRHRKLGNNL
jgi:hypothetical protein